MDIRKVFVIVVWGVLLMVSCSKDDYAPELCFAVSLTEVSDFSATITVAHTGTNSVSYYAIAVPGEIVDIDTEILKHKNSVLTGSAKDIIYNQKKRVIKLSGLIPETMYTCIVYGVDDNANIIGRPNSIYFKTKESFIEFDINPKWNIKYLGQNKYNGKTYSQVVVYVEVDVEERYFIKVYNMDVVKEYPDMRSLIIKAYSDFSNERNEFGDEYFWIEDNFVRTESTNFYQYLTKGQYQAFAIGVDAQGNLTGHYACSEIFEFDHYELEPGYAELLGDWELADGVGGEILFTLSEKWANSTLTMSGFGFNDCPLTLEYTPEENYLLTISGQSAIGVPWGKEEKSTMTLRAWYLDEDDKFMIYTASIINTLACSKEKNEDGTYTFSPGFNITLKNGEDAKTLGMLLTHYNEENKLFYYNSSKIQLPFTMRKLD